MAPAVLEGAGRSGLHLCYVCGRLLHLPYVPTAVCVWCAHLLNLDALMLLFAHRTGVARAEPQPGGEPETGGGNGDGAGCAGCGGGGVELQLWG
jgi:hypothetical protein